MLQFLLPINQNGQLPAPAKPAQFLLVSKNEDVANKLGNSSKIISSPPTNHNKSETLLPPENTTCSMFSFRKEQTFDLRRLQATVTNHAKCHQAMHFTQNRRFFCLQVENLSSKQPPRGWERLTMKPEYKEYLNKKRGKLPEGEFPVFCTKWFPNEMDSNLWSSRKKNTTIFTGFASYKKINSKDIKVVVQLVF